MGRPEAFGVCTGLLCVAAAFTVDAAPHAATFGPGGVAPRAPEIMVYFSHAVGGGIGGGSLRPTFGLRVDQVREGANNGDPEQGDPMQHRELLDWQMDGHSHLRFAETRLKLGNKLTYDFSNRRFGSPAARSAMQLGAPSLRNASPAQPRTFTLRSAPEGFGAHPAGRDQGRDNSNLHEIAAAAISALAPTRLTAPQRQMPQRRTGFGAIASAQRMQATATLH